MRYVTVILTRNHKVGSAILRTAMWSQWSHCALVDGGYIIEASATKAGRHKAGVRVRLLSELLAESSHHEYIKIPCSDPHAALAWALMQVGRPYDYRGVLGFPLRGDWQADDSWFCSELVAAAINSVEPRFRPRAGRITVEHLYIPIFP